MTTYNESVVDTITKEERERHRRPNGSIDHDAATPAIAERLTLDQLEIFADRLGREADEELVHAEEFETYRQRKFGVNDNGKG
jgi:hypothetical protein